LCRELEGVENRITIICGDPGDHEALFQSFTNNTGKITLKQNFDPNSHESILNLSHETCLARICGTSTNTDFF
jgi:hypothetical protein